MVIARNSCTCSEESLFFDVLERPDLNEIFGFGEELVGVLVIF